MLIVQSQSTDVYRNLAVEEWLLENAPSLPVLFLYVNDPCVVIGKNQNPWRECRLSLMKEEGVELARRVSGGGAVYHDAGNLNVSVIVPRTKYIEQQQYDYIFHCLNATALRQRKLSRMGTSSLTVDGLKFSGQAFCHRRDCTLHHGTILVNADLNRLGRYLGPEVEGIETKAIASVPAKVANLLQFVPELTIEKLSEILIENFKSIYGSDGVAECLTDDEIHKNGSIMQLIKSNSSTAWTLEHTPTFFFQGLEIVKGRVVNLPEQPLFAEWVKIRPA